MHILRKSTFPTETAFDIAHRDVLARDPAVLEVFSKRVNTMSHVTFIKLPDIDPTIGLFEPFDPHWISTLDIKQIVPEASSGLIWLTLLGVFLGRPRPRNGNRSFSDSL